MEYSILTAACKLKKIPIGELSRKVNLTPAGLKRGWEKDTITYRNYKKIIEILGLTDQSISNPEINTNNEIQENDQEKSRCVTKAEFDMFFNEFMELKEELMQHVKK